MAKLASEYLSCLLIDDISGQTCFLFCQVATFKAGSWQLTIMQYLSVEEGWGPLIYYAPSSGFWRRKARKELQGGGDTLPAPATKATGRRSPRSRCGR